MASFSFIPQSKKVLIFLNISFLFFLTFYLRISNFPDKTIEPTTITAHSIVSQGIMRDGCSGLHDYGDYKSQCIYVKSHIGCKPKGYINYLQIFYCTCGKFPILGHAVLLLWLAVLFYLLGNTAASYFCSSLESLSRILKLPPTIAGVTLLSLGNGASDVFASIVSFTRSGDGDVGLNSILGGAFFISSIVVGVISIVTSPMQISVDKPSFIRDVLFFLFSLCSLLIIILIGKINLWGAICFVSIYLIYVSTVSASYLYHRNEQRKMNQFGISAVSNSYFLHIQDDFGERGIPLLGYVDDEKPILMEKNSLGLEDDEQQSLRFSSFCYYFSKFLDILELPLYLPRRVTIPVVSEDKWSKPYAVISVTLAPLLLATLLNTQSEKHLGKRISLVSYMVAGFIGIFLGNLALVTTKASCPPKKCLFPWLAGGFLMSVTWTYITAEELVSLLVSIGHILGINPSVLGLTVLAWGNSLGDLIANVAMSMNGGANGAQIAISGCYAGPMFNTLVGLGMSLVFSSSSETYLIPRDSSLYETIGFLMGGLLWALVILPRKNMKLDKFLGVGLLAIYSCFLCLRLARALGILKPH
ncbi:Cation/calcium exchanger like [Melia azedarach]|uniref:Cation/calcium exchanger like n=1 Tax=Melia azedarach TaxID=155640 RepID=A0ACC1YCY3_MELAZ|nr:Cation/calcium exchanger like [Melia azedarach]